MCGCMKHCKKCNKNYSEHDEFCEECGGKLTKFFEAKEEEPKPEKKPKIHETKQIPTRTIVILVTAIVVFLLIITFIEVATNYNSSHPNCRQVQEPYTVQVPYQDTESYQYTFQYKIQSFTCTGDLSLSLGVFYKCVAQITNQENEGGQFTANFNMISSTNKQYTDTKTNYIASYGTQDFEAVFDTSMGEVLNGTVSVNPPITTKYRPVTKYRDETQYRTVMKCD